MIESRLFITEKISTAPSVFRFARIPAVSISRYFLPSRSTITSIASRVVPGISEAMTRSNPASVLTSVDFPTFGRPTTAIRGRSASFASVASPASARAGIRATIASSSSDTPVPCSAETAWIVSTERAWNWETPSLPSFASTLFAASRTGFPRSRSIPAISLSRGSSPSRESTRKTTRSDS